MDIYRKQPVGQDLAVVLNCVHVGTRDRAFGDVDKVIVGCLPGIGKDKMITIGRHIGRYGYNKERGSMLTMNGGMA